MGFWLGSVGIPILLLKCATSIESYKSISEFYSFIIFLVLQISAIILLLKYLVLIFYL